MNAVFRRFKQWWGGPGPLSPPLAAPHLELLAFIEAHQDELDTSLEARYGRGPVKAAVRAGLIRLESHQLPDWDYYRLTALGRATLKAE